MNGVWVTVRSNYGQRAIYPDNDTAEKVAALTGKKTLSARDLALCKLLGFGMAIEGTRADLAAVNDEIDAHMAALRRPAWKDGDA